MKKIYLVLAHFMQGVVNANKGATPPPNEEMAEGALKPTFLSFLGK